MDTNYKEPTQDNINAWAKEWCKIDKKKRSVLMISVESVDDGKNLNVCQLTQGQFGPLLNGLVEVMRRNENLSELICRAALKLAEEEEFNKLTND